MCYTFFNFQEIKEMVVVDLLAQLLNFLIGHKMQTLYPCGKMYNVVGVSNASRTQLGLENEKGLFVNKPHRVQLVLLAGSAGFYLLAQMEFANSSALQAIAFVHTVRVSHWTVYSQYIQSLVYTRMFLILRVKPLLHHLHVQFETVIFKLRLFLRNQKLEYLPLFIRITYIITAMNLVLYYALTINTS